MLSGAFFVFLLAFAQLGDACLITRKYADQKWLDNEPFIANIIEETLIIRTQERSYLDGQLRSVTDHLGSLHAMQST